MLSALPEIGLLEQAWLVPEGGWLRGPDGAVGLVRQVSSGWREWLVGPTRAVHESGEEPLVFTLRRSWSLWPSWEVMDSEGECVGTVGGIWLLDRWDEPVVQAGPDGVFLGKAGAVLGTWREGRLEFADASRGEPFLRMLMLAAVLAS